MSLRRPEPSSGWGPSWRSARRRCLSTATSRRHLPPGRPTTRSSAPSSRSRPSSVSPGWSRQRPRSPSRWATTSTRRSRPSNGVNADGRSRRGGAGSKGDAMSWRFGFLLRQRFKESLWVVPFLGAVLGLLTNGLDHTARVPGRGSTRPPPPPGYPDETTALDAMDEAERLSGELIIQPDAIAAIVRNKQGKIRVTTNRHPVGRGATWGMLWGTLFGMLFFVPFLGMAVGAGLAALMGKVEKTGIDKQFQRQVRDMLQPGTSALFLVVEKVTPDKAVEALNKFGGAVLKSSLSKEAEQELQHEYEEDQRFADTDQAPPAPASPPPAATGTGIADELERLKGLLDQSALTPAEFDAAKQKVLGSA